MLFKYLGYLNSKRVVLASGSPRRKEILESINIHPVVLTSSFEENLNPSSFPTISDYVIATAHGKAQDVALQEQEAELVIAADTMVVLDGELMGKPKLPEHAATMLRKLSGRTHQVYTGVVLIWPGNNTTSKFCEVTNVTFAQLDNPTIQLYVDSREPLDKAGGYGIQGLGGSLIESIQGDFYTVMGLPLHKLTLHIKHHYDNHRVSN